MPLRPRAGPLRSPLTPVRISLADVLTSLALASAWVALVRPGGLDLPYFWDEADVYVPGARWVATHGLDVTPGVFPDDYSRGHPPLLYFIAGAAFAAFGASPMVGHLVVLPFTVAALAGTYLLGAQLFGRSTGIAAALLLGTTPLFMSIGNMLLPEIPLTALAVLSFFALARGRLGWAVVLGAVAVSMKETGIFAAAGIGAAVLFDGWERGALTKRPTLIRAGIATVPLLWLGLFFVWQRVHAGYYVFPHHANLFADRPFEASNAVTVFPSIVIAHGRWLGLVWLGLGIRECLREPHPPTTSPSDGHDERWRPRRAAVLVGFAVTLLANAIFFAKMFWLERYALPVHPLWVVAVAGSLFALSKRLPVPAVMGLLFVAAMLGATAIWAPAPRDAEEHTFAYAHVIETHRRAFDSLEDDRRHTSEENPTHVLTTWPMTVELRYPYLGFVEREVSTVNIRYLADHPNPAVTHVLVNTASDRADSLREEARQRGLHRSSTHQVGHAPALEVWSR